MSTLFNCGAWLKYYMKTLWTFGDSFAECYNDHLDQYHNQIARKFNLKHNSYGLSGTSLSYTSFKFNEVRDDINDNDIVIIVLTNLFRKWFFEDRPKEAALGVNLSISEKQAIKGYMLYLENEKVNEINLLDFLYNVEHATEKKKLQTLVICAFADTYNFVKPIEHKFSYIKFANGYLDTITKNECSDDFYKAWTNVAFEKTGDSRLNHMIKSNHTILADRICTHMVTGKKVDLRYGYIENVINMNIKDNELFHKKEFFGEKWMFGL